MKNKNSNILVEYFEYFLEGLRIVISEYPIIIGVFFIIIGIKSYLKILEKKPIDYKTTPATSSNINDIRMRSNSWLWIIFIIILGVCLIMNRVLKITE